MAEKPIVIAATKKSVGGRGEYPARYVVLKWFKWSSGILKVKEYSRHMEVFDGVHEGNFKFGHYFCDAQDAIDDMVRTMNANNEDYPAGNISHMPGVDFINADLIE